MESSIEMSSKEVVMVDSGITAFPVDRRSDTSSHSPMESLKRLSLESSTTEGKRMRIMEDRQNSPREDAMNSMAVELFASDFYDDDDDDDEEKEEVESEDFERGNSSEAQSDSKNYVSDSSSLQRKSVSWRTPIESFSDTTSESSSAIGITSDQPATTNTLESQSILDEDAIQWTVQEARNMINMSNMKVQTVDFLSNVQVVLTLTSYPFRIFHASQSLTSSIGEPLSKLINCQGMPLLQVAPFVPAKCILQGNQTVETKLVQVISKSTLIYYAIVLQDTAPPSRSISPLKEEQIG